MYRQLEHENGVYTLTIAQMMTPPRKSDRIGLPFTQKNSDFCDGAKLRRADLDNGYRVKASLVKELWVVFELTRCVF